MKSRTSFLVVTTALLFSTAFAWADIPICLQDDPRSCIQLSTEAATELSMGHNRYGDDIIIRLDRVNRILKVTAYKASTNEEIPNFWFENRVAMQLGPTVDSVSVVANLPQPTMTVAIASRRR